MDIPAARAIHDRVQVDPHHLTRCVLAIRLVAVVSIITSPLWLSALFFSIDPHYYSFTLSLIGVPLLVLVSAVVILHFTQRDPYLRRLLLTGLAARMAASGIYLWVGLTIYLGSVDAIHYWSVGQRLAYDFQTAGWSVFQPPYWSTNLICNISGIAMILIGDALPALFIAFALVPLAGGYLFYRAFTLAFPDGDRWLFGLLSVLSPSLLYWSSFIGKDSLIQSFIALTCLGFAHITHRPSLGSVLLCAVGLAGTLLIRPHVAVIAAIAIMAPYVVGRSRTGGGATRILLIPLLAVATYFLVSEAREFLFSTTNSENSISAYQEAETITKNTQLGGSAFNQGTSLPTRIAGFPFLMFRPFPWEMHNVMSLISAVESLGLMALCWVRRREIWSTLRHWRDPYVCFLVTYFIVFSVTFSGAISNFGILARQRIMMTPLVFMLLCVKQKLPVRLISQRLRNNARLGRVPVSA